MTASVAKVISREPAEGATPAITITRLSPAAPMLSPRIRRRAAVGWPRPASHSRTATIREVVVHWATTTARYGASQAGRASVGPGRLGRARVAATMTPARPLATSSVRPDGRSRAAVKRNSR